MDSWPGLRKLYFDYKNYGWDDIPLCQGRINLPNQVVEVLQEVWETYGGFTANQLERLTHSEIPWIEVRKNVNIDESSNRKINIKTIYDYYSKQLVNE